MEVEIRLTDTRGHTIGGTAPRLAQECRMVVAAAQGLGVPIPHFLARDGQLTVEARAILAEARAILARGAERSERRSPLSHEERGPELSRRRGRFFGLFNEEHQ